MVVVGLEFSEVVVLAEVVIVVVSLDVVVGVVEVTVGLVVAAVVVEVRDADDETKVLDVLSL